MKKLLPLVLSFLPLLLGTGCSPVQRVSAGGEGSQTRGTKQPAVSTERDGLASATFAGGCFWCMEKPFEKLEGIHEVISGYTGGDAAEPSYRQVSSGRTGHAEAVRVVYDPSRVSYEDLLQVFWRQVNPTDEGGQFADRGSQYRTAIFVHDERQRAAAQRSKAELAASGRFDDPIVTPIEPAGAFYRAEEYHQDYYRKNPRRYEQYRRGSGRARYLEATWGEDLQYQPKGPGPSRDADRESRWTKPPADELRRRLTPLQYRVTQQEGTEPAFDNEYWNEKQPGLYVDVVSGEPLFSSTHKYASGTGWPSFWRPLSDERLTTRTDHHLGYPRTEVRSARADSHLGHVFSDGPPPTGKRYCINSAALRFVPKERLEEEGYGEYSRLFEEE